MPLATGGEEGLSTHHHQADEACPGSGLPSIDMTSPVSHNDGEKEVKMLFKEKRLAFGVPGTITLLPATVSAHYRRSIKPSSKNG